MGYELLSHGDGDHVPHGTRQADQRERAGNHRRAGNGGHDDERRGERADCDREHSGRTHERGVAFGEHGADERARRRRGEYHAVVDGADARLVLEIENEQRRHGGGTQVHHADNGGEGRQDRLGGQPSQPDADLMSQRRTASTHTGGFDRHLAQQQR
jgi:hypothetical protein